MMGIFLQWLLLTICAASFFHLVVLFCFVPNQCRSSNVVVIPQWQSVISDTGSVIPLFREKKKKSVPRTNASDDDRGPRGGRRRSSSPEWIFSSADRVYTNIPATVPGDVVSDLWKAGYLNDPYYDRNFLIQQHVWMGGSPAERATRRRTRIWRYETFLDLPHTSHSSRNDDCYYYLLILEGIKMGATVSLNGMTLGVIRNQFVRTVLPLPPELLHRHISSSSKITGSSNRLAITFDPEIDAHGRFMACSGGWDWAPYTRAIDARGSRIFTLGIVQPIYVVPVHSVWIEHVAIQIHRSESGFRKHGQWPTDRQDFVVQVQIQLQWMTSHCDHNCTEDRPDAVVRIQSTFSSRVTRVSAPDPSSTVLTVNLTATQVRLWWPVGLGGQPLYTVQVALESPACCIPNGGSCDACSVMEKRIGFRTLNLITTSRRNASLDSGDGSGDHGMYIRVNDAIALWCRGSNLIPMDQLEGRQNVHHPSDGGSNVVTSYRWAVESAVRANMNMIRVWGGGVVPPSEFYDACDEKGILIYQDLMFVEENGHGAFRDETVRAEIERLVRQLSHHPSIALWNGCNECNADMDVYASFVMQTVAKVDQTRIIWPSSPSAHGWASGVYTANGKPNGKPLRIRIDPSRKGSMLEAHGPYQHGFSNKFPAVNGFPGSNWNETLLPPTFQKQNVGESYPNTFVSEFGSSVSSSFESMSVLLPPSKWSLHGGEGPDTCHHDWGNLNVCNGTNALAERNYPCDSRIEAYFGKEVADSLDNVGQREFQRQLYLCMIAQALWIKGTIETFRSGNSYGTLLWQLNENWPTGGWGCIEYHDSYSQFGRWKPLMYLLRSFLFRDVLVACGHDACYVRNDSPEPQSLAVSIEAWNFEASRSVRDLTLFFSLPPGRSQRWFTLPPRFNEEAHVVLLSTNLTADDATSPSVYLWNLPMDLPLQPVQFRVQVAFHNSRTSLEFVASGLALYVVISTAVPGHFSDNAFVLRPRERKRIDFTLPLGYKRQRSDPETFLKTLRVQHLGTNSTWFVETLPSSITRQSLLKS